MQDSLSDLTEVEVVFLGSRLSSSFVTYLLLSVPAIRHLFPAMTISLTFREFLEQYQESEEDSLHFDASDRLDITQQHNGKIGQAWRRSIQLREGILLLVCGAQHCDRLLVNRTEYKQELQWHFFLSGKQLNTYSSSYKQTSLSLGGGRYIFTGSGVEDRLLYDCSDTELFLEVEIILQPEVLRSFIGDSSGELPKSFNPLVGASDHNCYKRVGETTPIVNAILHQIIQCPYQGLTKRMYLEGKATELMALMLEEEAAVQQGDFKAALLQPDQLDRVYYAKEILLEKLNNPPSLMELARQVGMCDYNLKRGFKEIFGTTVFGYLRDRRLEKAQQLLLEQKMTVALVARAVGYDSPTSFTTAFKRKFGVNPKAYQISARK